MRYASASPHQRLHPERRWGRSSPQRQRRQRRGGCWCRAACWALGRSPVVAHASSRKTKKRSKALGRCYEGAMKAVLGREGRLVPLMPLMKAVLGIRKRGASCASRSRALSLSLPPLRVVALGTCPRTARVHAYKELTNKLSRACSSTRTHM